MQLDGNCHSKSQEPRTTFALKDRRRTPKPSEKEVETKLSSFWRRHPQRVLERCRKELWQVLMQCSNGHPQNPRRTTFRQFHDEFRFLCFAKLKFLWLLWIRNSLENVSWNYFPFALWIFQRFNIELGQWAFKCLICSKNHFFERILSGLLILFEWNHVKIT